MNPSLTFSLPALAENISRIQQSQPDSTRWVPEIRSGIPHACLTQILDALQHFSDDTDVQLASLNVQQAFELSQLPVLQQSGRRLSWLITSPISSLADSDRLAELLQSCRVTVVADHFRHLELASLAAKRAGHSAGILIDVDTGQHVTGACPGPDTVALARAISQLTAVNPEGLFTRIHHVSTGEQTPSEQVLSAVRICHHCQRMIQDSQIHCKEILVDYIPHSALPVFPGTGFLNSPFLVPPQSIATHNVPVTLSAEVLSRPSLDHCIINAGSLLLNAPPAHISVTEPVGGSVVRLLPDHAVLLLTSDALDLRIGDRVQLWSPGLHHLSAKPADCVILR